MSLLKPSILVNPQNATNNFDPQKAGWYQIQPSSSNVALRIAYSNIGLTGEIRLNTTVSPPIFQGNNGSAWVSFNATKGETGSTGKDFTNAVKFNNLGSNTSAGTAVSLGSIFATTTANVAANLSSVNIRSLQGSSYTVNSNLSVSAISLRQNSNVIVINSSPIPYNWDFTGTKNTISYLKNINNSGWGETSNWIVKTGTTVNRGQAVRLTKDTTTSNIVIAPFTYTLGNSPMTTPLNILGIATSTVSGGGTCAVCTKGITTIRCTSNTTPTGFTRNTTMDNVGYPGIISSDGFAFYNSAEYPTYNYIKGGYFLESGNVAGDGSYVLFYVEPSIQIV